MSFVTVFAINNNVLVYVGLLVGRTKLVYSTVFLQDLAPCLEHRGTRIFVGWRNGMFLEGLKIQRKGISVEF